MNIPAEAGEIGGDGGAIYTGLNSTTVFERRAVMRFNVGASGGALYNLGTTILETAGYIRGNDALVRNEPSTVPSVDIGKATAVDGGHFPRAPSYVRHLTKHDTKESQ